MSLTGFKEMLVRKTMTKLNDNQLSEMSLQLSLNDVNENSKIDGIYVTDIQGWVSDELQKRKI